jgi:hypothetical protein
MDMNAAARRFILREWARVPITERQTDEQVVSFVLRLVARAPRTMMKVKGLDEVRELLRSG